MCQISGETTRIQHYKYLGVIRDANLNFKQHLDKLLVKVSKRIGVLGRVRNNLTVDSANKVYQSLVFPVMDYCDVAWSSIGKIEKKIVLKTKDSDAEKNLRVDVSKHQTNSGKSPKFVFTLSFILQSKMMKFPDWSPNMISCQCY